jgi:hypothetical protein
MTGLNIFFNLNKHCNLELELGLVRQNDPFVCHKKNETTCKI